jgi:hypothetical protein
MRAAVRLPGMRRACPSCSLDRTTLPHHVGRRASGWRKVRAHHRRTARPGKIARSRMQLLRRPGFEDGETCQGESVSASLNDLASRAPANFPQADPISRSSPWHPLPRANAPAGTSGRERLKPPSSRRRRRPASRRSGLVLRGRRVGPCRTIWPSNGSSNHRLVPVANAAASACALGRVPAGFSIDRRRAAGEWRLRDLRTIARSQTSRTGPSPYPRASKGGIATASVCRLLR